MALQLKCPVAAKAQLLPKQRAAKSKAVILATLTADVEIGFGGELGCKFFCELPF